MNEMKITDKDDSEEKLKDIKKEFHDHGMKCGSEVAKLAKIMHPNALCIVPLYRSCIVIEQNDNDKKEGDVTIHAYGDPHWLGGDITIDELKKTDFHKVLMIKGDRQGPILKDYK